MQIGRSGSFGCAGEVRTASQRCCNPVIRCQHADSQQQHSGGHVQAYQIRSARLCASQSRTRSAAAHAAAAPAAVDTGMLLTRLTYEAAASQPSGQSGGGGGAFGEPLAGSPMPLGATYLPEQGVTNFAIFSSSATAVSLVLFTEADLQAGRRTHEIELDQVLNRSGDTWHIALPQLDASLLYGYRLEGPHEQARPAVASAADSAAEPPDTDAAAEPPEMVVSSPGHRFNSDAVVLDPYARAVIGRRQFGELGLDIDVDPGGAAVGVSRTWPQSAGALPEADGFDWQGDQPLRLPQEDLVIYEMHVRGFTQAAPDVRAAGTYAGIVEKLPYLRRLGVNAIELLPVHEFNELEYYAMIPGTDEYRFNFWGYSTVNFFSPMARYSQAAADGAGGGAIIDEFKTLVREAHKAGIEVILDVVFNHTAEGNEQGPTISFRGLDNRVYYMLAPQGQYYNFSGCGNTLNCNHPVVQAMIIAALRYWVQEMHVDGFRFDLGSIMTRAHSVWHPATNSSSGSGSSGSRGQAAAASSGNGAGASNGAAPAAVDDPGLMPDGGAGVPTGTPLTRPPLVEAISEDPILCGTKLIAEAWDCGPLMQVGAFPHYGGRWAEWNGRFRDTVRTFIKGTEGPWAAAFANAMGGSPDIYSSSQPPEDDWWGNNGGGEWRGGREPRHSINFITAHDGFPLADLVAYNEKHNEANGEQNRDGEQHNLTWNCGEEGLTSSPAIASLRARQVRNLAAALLLSHGVPMFAMGDEYGHSKGGNNNTYCFDSPLNWVDWQAAEDPDNAFARFFRNLVALRRRRRELRRGSYAECGIQWHGTHVGQPDFSEGSRLVAYTIAQNKFNCTGSPDGGLYIAFNSSHRPAVVDLPHWAGRRWQLFADSGKRAPFDCLVADEALASAPLAQARADSAAWTDEHAYALLPYSFVVLESLTEEQLAEQQVAALGAGDIAAQAPQSVTKPSDKLAAAKDTASQLRSASVEQDPADGST